MHISTAILSAAALSQHARAGNRINDYADDNDLASFVTRPDIRPPKFNITMDDQNAITPGYWFVSPYVDLYTRIPTTAFKPDQVGPHIFDGQGNLVWSGAYLFGDRATFDFKAVNWNGSSHLTVLTGHDENAGSFTSGAGIIMDSTYTIFKNVVNKEGSGLMNMHEFNIPDRENKALTITYDPQLYDFSEKPGDGQFGWIGNNGFQEVDLDTGGVVFSWWALDHVDPYESSLGKPQLPGFSANAWDFFHMNSVDKNSDGDYLISARYTNCIYKISGHDGSIMWRLGGYKSSFKLDGFNFSSQHDARFRDENGTITTITFLNNAANGHTKTADYSSAMMVSLDTSTMEARLIRSWDRPDKTLTKLRGNVQTLPNGNIFTCWSENSYISEFTSDGRRVMEAQFSSHRFVTYRAYKFNFTGTPLTRPVLKAYVYGVDPSTSTTTYYVSWNGATEVASWRFYGTSSANAHSNLPFIGSVDKHGFESMFMKSGYLRSSYVEAVSADGRVLQRSSLKTTVIPKSWKTNDAAEANVAAGNRKPIQNHMANGADLQKQHVLSSKSLVSGWHSDVMTKQGLAIIMICMASIFCCILYICLRLRMRRVRLELLSS